MKSRWILLAVTLTVSIVAVAGNNDWPNVLKDCHKVTSPPPPRQGDPPVDPFWKRTAGCAKDFFTARPAHVTVKSVVPGGGFGLGPTYGDDFNHDKWQNRLTATGVSTLRQFWAVNGMFKATHDRFGENNSARDRFAVEVYTLLRGLARMPYYGIGPTVTQANVTHFSEQDVIFGAHVFNPFSSWFAAGARLESIWPQIDGVRAPGIRSINSVFNESTAPGLTSQPNLIHSEVYGNPRHTEGNVQFDYKVGYNFYHDTDTGHYSFRRFRVDGTHTFFLWGNEHILTIHNRLTLSDTTGTHVVPFYMQETLGGSDINGQPTLRGFLDYRFRAPDLMLFQVEYDHRVWGPIGLLGFYDTGEVANRASDLSFADMRHSFGFGMSVWAGNKAWFKVYVGLGSGEGAHPYFGIPSF